MEYAYILIIAFVTLSASLLTKNKNDTNRRQSVKEFVQEALKVALQHQHRSDADDTRYLLAGADKLTGPSTVHQNALFSATKKKAREKAVRSTIFFHLLQRLCNTTEMSLMELRRSSDFVNEIKAQAYGSACISEPIFCNRKAIYRTADGSCNNLKNPTWGKAFIPQPRYLPAEYEDGLGSPRQKSANGLDDLPNPRVISNTVHSQKKETIFHPSHSVMVMQWGQFLDHDLVATPATTGKGGAGISCCDKHNNKREREACFPITIPENDEFLSFRCMDFVRSAPAESEDCLPGTREQMNQITSFIDGSNVYGSSLDEQDSLRSKTGGMLKTGPDNLLPDSDKDDCIKETENDYCQQAGDGRVNVVPSLGTMHTAFVREHNRLATRLSILNPGWHDERLFQETKKIVAAEIQHVTYNEFLPVILGKAYMRKYGLESTTSGFRTVYDSEIDASIRNVFGVAAFRFGHSTIPNHQAHNNIETTYNRPHMVQTRASNGESGVSHIGRWLVGETGAKNDRFIEDGLRNHLFKDSNGDASDLVARNIQRGRDHGIPSYNAWRQFCGLPIVWFFGTTTGGLIHHTKEDAAALNKAYLHPDDIDLFTGGVSEIHIEGGNVGPTFACLLAEQFQDLKFGDRFFYENKFHRTGFTREQVIEVKRTKLSKILCDNLQIDEIQENAFFVSDFKNRKGKCSDLPNIDLSKWQPQNHRPSFDAPCSEP